MRVMSIFFAFLLVMGISLGGSALVGGIPAMAQDDPQGEMPGGEMTDEATDGSGAATGAADEATPGEMPGGEMTDEATDGSGAETDAPDESTEGEMPGGEMPDDAAK